MIIKRQKYFSLGKVAKKPGQSLLNRLWRKTKYGLHRAHFHTGTTINKIIKGGVEQPLTAISTPIPVPGSTELVWLVENGVLKKAVPGYSKVTEGLSNLYLKSPIANTIAKAPSIAELQINAAKKGYLTPTGASPIRVVHS